MSMPQAPLGGAWGTQKARRPGAGSEKTYSAPPSPPSPAPPAAPAAPAEPAAPPLPVVVLEPPPVPGVPVVLPPPEPPPAVVVLGAPLVLVPPAPSSELLSSPPQPTAARLPLSATKASRLVRFFMLRFLRINQKFKLCKLGTVFAHCPCAQSVPNEQFGSWEN